MAKTKVKVITMDRKEFTVNVENYDPVAIFEALNDDESRTVLIGDAVFERVDVRRVIPADPDTE